MGLESIVFWNFQKIYLAKHIRMLDSTKRKPFTQYLKITWLSVRTNKIRAKIY